MTLILIILLLNTALFIALLVNTAKATKESQDKYLEIKRDNELWKTKVMEKLKDIYFINMVIDHSADVIQDLLYKNK